MAYTVPIAEPRPSQLYLDASRLRDALEWFDADEPEYDPIPLLHLDGEVVLSDGHTRAFCAYLAGAEELSVVDDPDRDELNLPLYRECVRWCREASLATVGDLAGRLVSEATFERKWIERCQSHPLAGESE